MARAELLQIYLKKESCEQDSPPAAGRCCDILLIRRSAILAERFI